MLAPIRQRLPVLRGLRAFSITPRTLRSATDNPVPANDPNPTAQHSPVSATNATATSSEGSFDKALQESVEEGEKKRVMQAPNRATVWSRSQQPREKAMVGPRFEQTIMEDQVRDILLLSSNPRHWVCGVVVVEAIHRKRRRSMGTPIRATLTHTHPARLEKGRWTRMRS